MFHSKTWVGVDIGTSGIKFAKLKGRAVKEWGFESLPLGAVAAGLIKDRGSVLKALKDLVNKHDLRKGNLVTCVGGRDVIIRTITLPFVEKGEMKRFLEWEVERNIPFGIDEALYDYHVMRRFQDQEGEKLEILIIAIKRSLSEEVYNLFFEAGVELEAIEAMPLPLLRVGGLLEERESFMLIDIGAGTTDMAIVHEGRLILFRSLPTGGNALSSSLSASLGLNYGEAEELKKVKEIEELKPHIEDVLATIVNETMRCFDYVIGQYKENVVRNVFITGGCASLKGLDLFLERALNIPVRKLNPLIGLTLKEEAGEELKSRWGLAIGLALRGL